MRKTTRSILITALILFCAGLLLSLGASLYGIIANKKIFTVEKKDRTIENTAMGIEEILSVSPEAAYKESGAKEYFHSVDITSFAGDIRIVTGSNKTELVLEKANTENLNVEICGSTLVIEEVDPVGIFGFYIGKDGVSFKGLRHVFSPGNAINSGKTITLYLEKGTNLETLDIDSYAGNVKVQGIDCQNLEIKADYGDICLSKLKNASGKISITGCIGNVNLEGNAYSSCSINTKIGNITADLITSEGQSTVVDLWCGDVDIKTDLPVSSYKLSLASTLGKIYKDNKSVGKQYKENGTSSTRISSTLFIGEFSIEKN